MAPDLSLPPPQPAAARERPPGPGRVVVAGVLGACVLGAGLGLWARPASPEVAAAVEAPPPRPALQVVVDDTPMVPPAGSLLEVLPADLATPGKPHALPRLIPVEPLAPRRTAGLVKVDAIVAPDAAPTPKLPPVPAPKPVKVQAAERPASVDKAVEASRNKRTEATRVAKAERPVKAKPADKPAKLAKVEPRPKAKVAKGEAKPTRLAAADKPAKAAKAAPKKALAKPKAVAATKKKDKPVQLAAAKPQKKASKAKASKSQAKAEVVKAKATRPPPARKPKVERARVEKAPPPRRVTPRGEGPMRVARADGCARVDPGEAIVCADRRLAARDRQLQQAYRDAEAAGVPASALRRQQDRWVQARAAAAREAPWAVEDVYVARISELHDLSRDARDN